MFRDAPRKIELVLESYYRVLSSCVLSRSPQSLLKNRVFLGTK